MLAKIGIPFAALILSGLMIFGADPGISGPKEGSTTQNTRRGRMELKNTDRTAFRPAASTEHRVKGQNYFVTPTLAAFVLGCQGETAVTRFSGEHCSVEVHLARFEA
jgi:hypothetical protein